LSDVPTRWVPSPKRMVLEMMVKNPGRPTSTGTGWPAPSVEKGIETFATMGGGVTPRHAGLEGGEQVLCVPEWLSEFEPENAPGVASR